MSDEVVIDFQELTRRVQDKDGYKVVSIATIRAGKRVYKVRNPLDDWFHRKIITDRQYAAGDRFRMLYEATTSGCSSMRFDGAPPPESRLSRTPGSRILDAHRELMSIAKQLGNTLYSQAVTFLVRGEGVPESRSERLKYTGRIQTILDRISEIITEKA